MITFGMSPTGIVTALLQLVSGQFGIGICVILVILAAYKAAASHHPGVLYGTISAVIVAQCAAWLIG